MTEEEKTRQQEVQDYKDTIKEMKKEASQIKEIAQHKIESNKEICVDMDKLQDTLSKEEIVGESLTEEVVSNMPKELWDDMQSFFVRAANNYRGVSSLRRDIEAEKQQVQYFRTTASTLVGSNSTGALSAVHIITPYANQYTPAGKALATLKLTETWIDDLSFIKTELKKITPDVSKEFEGVVADMSGTGNANLKYKALLALRSVLFDQLLDIMAPEAQYCQTSWFQGTPTTPAAAPFRKKRFCQPKFFIFGNNDETAFPQSMIDAVNKTSSEMATHFHEMSEYGKEGGSETLVDNCYRETLTSFANAIRLRNQFQNRP